MEKSQKIRSFNLLFLEEDEEYIDDMLITMKTRKEKEDNKNNNMNKNNNNNNNNNKNNNENKNENGNYIYVELKGRLRLCSKSLIFEAYNVDEEVLKFPFKKLENIKLGIFKNEIIIKTCEVIRIKTIIHNKKTRCISQFIYERKYKKNINALNNLYNEYYDEYKIIDNNNIHEKIYIFEKILNNFDDFLDTNKSYNNKDGSLVDSTKENNNNTLVNSEKQKQKKNIKIENKRNDHMSSNIHMNDYITDKLECDNKNKTNDNNGNIQIQNKDNQCGDETHLDRDHINNQTKGMSINLESSTDKEKEISFLYVFSCENSSMLMKKMKHIYDLIVKIKTAMIINEKQMDILIKEKKNKYKIGNKSRADEMINKNTNIIINNNNNNINSNVSCQNRNVLKSDNTKENNHNKEMKRTDDDNNKRNEYCTNNNGVVKNKELNLDKYIESIMNKLKENIKFDISSINIHEKIITNRIDGFWVYKVSPLLKVKGILNITNKYIYFQPYPNFTNKKEKKWNVEKILHVFKRIITMKPNALEIIFENEKRKKYDSLYIEFISYDDREIIINILKRIKSECFFIEENKDFVYVIQEKWCEGYISNYIYLDFLNCIGGRSRKDFSQYPIYPWIISCYRTDEKLEYDNKEIYRDLKKPVGCLNKNRLNSLIEKMHDHDYFYGSHYSTLAYVVYFLIRLYPECQLKLQSGKFDTISRMFLSMESTYHTALNANSSFIELIPEFYEDDESFLKNNLNIITNEGNINDVILPKWCSNPKEFLIFLKNALESNYVNENLNSWIDLIFGYKQNGHNAKECFNLFHPLTYMHSILNEKLSRDYNNKDNYESNKAEKENTFEQNFNQNIKDLITTMSSKALKTQLHEFGQCPYQIFKQPHVSKKKIQTFVYNENISNYHWYYSDVINQLLRQEIMKKKNKKQKTKNKTKKKKNLHIGSKGYATNEICRKKRIGIVGGDNSLVHYDYEGDNIDGDTDDDVDDYMDDDVDDDVDDYMDDDVDDNVDDYMDDDMIDATNPTLSYNLSSDKQRDILMDDKNMKYENVNINNKRKDDEYCDYFKRYNWNLYRAETFSSCKIRGIASTCEHTCFSCNNGYIKLITHKDLLNCNIKNNNNFISLKISDDNFSSINNIQNNYVLGTSTGNIVFINPKSILNIDYKNKYNNICENKSKIDIKEKVKNQNINHHRIENNNNNNNDEYEHEFFSDDLSDDLFNFHSNDSSDFLYNSFEDIFYDKNENIYNNIYDHINNKQDKGLFFNDNNIYSQIISKKIHNDTINSISCSYNYITTASSDETIELINADTNFDIIQVYDNFNDKVRYVQLKNKLLFAMSNDLKLFDIRIGKKNIYLNNINNFNSYNKLFLNISSQNRSSKKKFIESARKRIYNNNNNNNNNNIMYDDVNNNMMYDDVNNNMMYDDINNNMMYSKNLIGLSYEDNYVRVNYLNKPFLYEKKIKKNIHSNFNKNQSNFIHACLINDYNILCVDEKDYLYFYDIRNEKWHNILSNSLMGTIKHNNKYKLKKKRNYKIVSAACNKQRLCLINDDGHVFYEHMNFCDSNNILSKTNFFPRSSLINTKYISFFNHFDDINNINNDYILFTTEDAQMEIYKKGN
ncbi:neutral-sphingomyelinase activation factor protein, putative [Plasmodium sp. gorilla clade G2]|uniref:neutral-sphingomyelinase activation factor protein, putative n=1 Tax=Plasmodium sp. gorilla clade G2 TaxID=880535 RepID=UPI000D215119|nr:neutral-sphingomyelinase activation factor protein, putative [Plasmodium sp. gorilla clade G2]SOV15690.1 neutral-sphingomyelinase activation factor protein, putative [Plasmodium sp. gorilla clade G2]